jgi:hypothetical protein
MGASSSTIRVLVKYVPRIKLEELELQDDDDVAVDDEDDEEGGYSQASSQKRLTRSQLRLKQEKKMQEALLSASNDDENGNGGAGTLGAVGGQVSKRPPKALFNPYERGVSHTSMERKDIRGVHYDVVQSDYLSEDGFAYKEVNPSTYCTLGIEQVNPTMEEMTLFLQGEAMAKKRRRQLGYDEDEDEEKTTYEDLLPSMSEEKEGDEQTGSSSSSSSSGNTTHVSQIEQLARQELEYQMTASASLQAKRQALPPSERFHIGDKVQVVIPEMRGIKGRVIATDDEKSVVEIQLTHYPDNRPIQPSSSSSSGGGDSSLSDSLIRLDPNDLEIWVDVGEKIVFVGGMYDGHAGTVVAVIDEEGAEDSSAGAGKKVVVLADGTNTEMIEDIAFCHQPNLHLFSNSQVQSLEGYALYDMVKISAFDSGMIIYVGTDHLDVINKSNKINRVAPADLLGKERANASANDHMHRSVRVGDKVKIIDKNIVGRHNIEEGIVKHIYQRVLFLHSPFYNKNSGILCVKANLTANMSAAAQSAMYGSFDSTNFRAPRPGGRKGNSASNNNNNNMAETLVGKTVRISRGLHKGQLGRVKNEGDESLLIELHSQLRTVSIPRSSIVEINSHKNTGNPQQSPSVRGGGSSSTSMSSTSMSGTGGLTGSQLDTNAQQEDDLSISSGSRTPYMSSQTPFASFESSERSSSSSEGTGEGMLSSSSSFSQGMDSGFDTMVPVNPFFDDMLSSSSATSQDMFEDSNSQYLENPYASSSSNTSSSSNNNNNNNASLSSSMGMMMNPLAGNSPMSSSQSPGGTPLNTSTNFFGTMASSFSPSSTQQSPGLNMTDQSPMHTNMTNMTDMTPMTPFEGTPSGQRRSRRTSTEPLSPELLKLSQALKGVIVNVMTETSSSLAVLLSIPNNLSSSLTPDTPLNIQDIEQTEESVSSSSMKFRLVGNPKMMMARYLTVSAASQKQKVVIPSDGNKVGKVRMIFDQEAVVMVTEQEDASSMSYASTSTASKGKKVKKAYDVKDLFPIFEDIFFTASSSSGSDYYGNNTGTGSAWGDNNSVSNMGSAWGDNNSVSNIGSAWGDNNSVSNIGSAWGDNNSTSGSAWDNNNNNNAMMNNSISGSTWGETSSVAGSAWGDSGNNDANDTNSNTTSQSPWGNAPSAWG